MNMGTVNMNEPQRTYINTKLAYDYLQDGCHTLAECDPTREWRTKIEDFRLFAKERGIPLELRMGQDESRRILQANVDNTLIGLEVQIERIAGSPISTGAIVVSAPADAPPPIHSLLNDYSLHLREVWER